MQRIIIDTNILYSLVGVHPNPKVTSTVIAELQKHQISVTTVSLIEIIVKYRADLDKVKKCLKPIVEQEYELITIGYLPIDNEKLISIYSALDLNEIQKNLDDIKALKIYKEAEFLRFILIIVISGIFKMLRENNGYKFQEDVKNNRQLLEINALIEGNEDYFLEYFKSALENGYKSGDPDKETLKFFEDLFLSLIESFYRLYHNINSSSFTEEAKLQQSIIYKLISKAKHTIIQNKHLDTIKNGISDLDGMTEEVINFLLFKIKNFYSVGAKIRKNDICDLLIIFSLYLKDTKIITLDTAFQKVLEKVDSNSYKLCEKLGFTK